MIHNNKILIHELKPNICKAGHTNHWDSGNDNDHTSNKCCYRVVISSFCDNDVACFVKSPSNCMWVWLAGPVRTSSTLPKLP